jgi:predicted nucleic acid-binding protein
MKLYLDAMLWIYAFEGHPTFGPLTNAFTQRMRSAQNDFLSSYLVLAEVLVLPKRNNDIFTATRYRRFFQSRAVAIVALSVETAERFADIRATTHVKPADAMHLALAASANTDYFVTYDAKLHALTIPGITQICSPKDVP